MKISKSLFLMKPLSLAAVALVACSSSDGDEKKTDPDPIGKGTLSQEKDVYKYVLGVDTASNRTLTGGAHEILIPGDREKADAIDSANQPGRLHPDLSKDAYKTYDPNIKTGETDFKVFPSSWWAQKSNGIAARWTGSAGSDYNDVSKVDDLSPSEKYDLVFYPGQQKQVAKVEHWPALELNKPEAQRTGKDDHPAVTVAGPTTKWELENHGLYQSFAHPDNWWGHCNGWSSYATAEPDGAPKRDIRIKLVSGKVTECTSGETGCTLFRMGDIEALMTEMYFSDQATFAGRRCNTDPDKMERDEYGRPKDAACRDLNPGAFHIGVTGLLSRGATYLGSGTAGKPAFVIDHNYDWEVWNFPLVKFNISEQQEVSKEDAAKLLGAREYTFNTAAQKFVRIKLTYWMVSDGVGASEMLQNAYLRGTAQHQNDLNYVLELDANGIILGGEWIKDPTYQWGEDSKQLHPDFFWMAVKHQGSGEDADDLGGSNDNPFVSYAKVKSLLKCANDPTSCAPPTTPDAGPPPSDGGSTGGPNSCVNICGKQASGGCWCDKDCSKYNDCCSDYGAACSVTTDAGTPPPPDAGTPGGPGCTQALCGTGTSSTGSDGKKCYCDSSCADYGDCCSNKATVCGS